MDYRLLELNLSELSKAWQKSKYNRYFDKNIVNYHNKLDDIVTKIGNVDLSTSSPTELEQYKSVSDFVFKSLEFLDNSIANSIPFETIFCLNTALVDWINKDEYIIVTGLTNGIYSFSFDPSLVMDNLIYANIKLLFDIEFEKKLIQINVPKYLSRDYLSTVALYHELGHFIGRKNNLEELILLEIQTDIRTGRVQIANVAPYLPAIAEATPFGQQINKNHISEYFCDLFASQYIGNTLSQYLNFITNGQTGWYATHPSTVNRIKVVDDYINSTSNYIVEKIISVMTKKVGEVRKRYEDLVEKDAFINMIPVNIESNSQLHTILIYGWDIWLNRREEIRKINNISFDISNQGFYEIINNLIEKSIGNYIVNNMWSTAKTNVSS